MKRKRIQRQKKFHVRRGDIVMAIAGEDADGKKTGKVLEVLRKQNRAIVEGFNYVKKHLRKSKDYPQGGIIEKEASVHISNLKVVKRHEERGAEADKQRK